MKTLFRIIIAFILGSVAGATRGLNKMKTEALNMATQMYQTSMELMLSGSDSAQGDQFEERKTNASQFLSGQIETFKESAKSQANQTIKDQIDKIFQ